VEEVNGSQHSQAGNVVPTIRDVAREAGVSIATVSRVINRTGHAVSQPTRERVLSAVEVLDYHPNAVAKSLSKRTTETIGVVIPDISNPYYAEIVRGIQDGAEEAGYTAILRNTDRSPKKAIEGVVLFREKLADGGIFVGGELPESEIQKALGKKPIAGIVIGRQNVSLPSVQIDNVSAAGDVVRHLISLGHSRIAFLSGLEYSHTMEDRLKGFRTAMETHNCPVDTRLISWGLPTIDDGYRRMSALLAAAQSKPSALVAVSDQVAMGAIRAAGERGLRVPEDLAVAGFDNTPLAPFFCPPLTTIDIPRYQMGAVAIRLLLGIMNGRQVPPVSWLPTRLIVRGSTRTGEK